MKIISRDDEVVEVEKGENIVKPERQIMLLVKGFAGYEAAQVWLNEHEARALAAVLLEFARDK